MRKYGFFVAACFVLFQCSNDDGVEAPASTEKYLHRFEKAAQSVGKDISVSSLKVIFRGRLSHAERAYCESGGLGKNTIVIDASHWERLSDNAREILVFHELGHCILDRNHIDDLRPDGSPVSIMHSHGVHPRHYQRHHEEYLQELFHKS